MIRSLQVTKIVIVAIGLAIIMVGTARSVAFTGGETAQLTRGMVVQITRQVLSGAVTKAALEQRFGTMGVRLFVNASQLKGLDWNRSRWGEFHKLTKSMSPEQIIALYGTVGQSPANLQTLTPAQMLAGSSQAAQTVAAQSRFSLPAQRPSSGVVCGTDGCTIGGQNPSELSGEQVFAHVGRGGRFGSHRHGVLLGATTATAQRMRTKYGVLYQKAMAAPCDSTCRIGGVAAVTNAVELELLETWGDPAFDFGGDIMDGRLAQNGIGQDALVSGYGAVLASAASAAALAGTPAGHCVAKGESAAGG